MDGNSVFCLNKQNTVLRCVRASAPRERKNMEGWAPDVHEVLAAQTLVLWSRREDARRTVEDCKRQLEESMPSAPASDANPPAEAPLRIDLDAESEIDSNASIMGRKSPSMKRAYRQIALHTHPDKTQVTDYTRRTFEFASKSLQEGDALGLAATWLRIDRTGFMAMPIEEVEELKLLLDQEEAKIKMLQGSVAFNWNRMSAKDKERFTHAAGTNSSRS